MQPIPSVLYTKASVELENETDAEILITDDKALAQILEEKNGADRKRNNTGDQKDITKTSE